MINFEHSQTIGRSPAEVLEQLIRFEDIPKFVPECYAAEQTSDGPVQVGTTFVQHIRMMGANQDVPTEVTVYEPPRRFGYRGDGSIPYEVLYTMTPVEAGTRLDTAVRMEARGAMRALTPLLRWGGTPPLSPESGQVRPACRGR